MSVIKGNLSDGKPMQVGGFYNGLVWNGSGFGAPGTDLSGRTVSNEVIGQTNPNNVAYISQLKGNTNLSLPATSTPASAGLQSTVDSARATLQAEVDKQQQANIAAMAQAKATQADITGKEQALSTPFVADMEASQRESLGINSNFQANQQLTDELGTLLQQGNDLIKQQQSVTGLASVRNPRVQDTMNDITARAGVIQAVMSARNSQISVAENMIDRSVNAIQADRQSQLTYYNTLLELNNRDILSLGGTEKDLANKQIDLLQNDLTQAQKTADYVKQLMIDPATAQLLGDAGVSLNDSVEQINAKIQQAQYVREVANMSNQVTANGAQAVLSPNGVPANQLITLTDSKGTKHYYQAPVKTTGGSTPKTADVTLAAGQAAAAGKTYQDMLAFFTQYGLTPKQIYQIYVSKNYYGRPPDNIDPKTGLSTAN